MGADNSHPPAYPKGPRPNRAVLVKELCPLRILNTGRSHQNYQMCLHSFEGDIRTLGNG